jgi:TonB family protein
VVGRVASAGVPGAGIATTGPVGRVAMAAAPTVVATAAPIQMATAPAMTNIEVISKPPVQYTSEARQLRIEGDVVLKVTFTAAGQVVINGVLRGLGHGLDEEARRVASQIRFRPATKGGQAVDATTTITITFQLA